MAPPRCPHCGMVLAGMGFVQLDDDQDDEELDEEDDDDGD